MIDLGELADKLDQEKFKSISLDDLLVLIEYFPYQIALALKKLRDGGSYCCYGCGETDLNNKSQSGVYFNGKIQDACSDCHLDWYYNL